MPRPSSDVPRGTFNDFGAPVTYMAEYSASSSACLSHPTRWVVREVNLFDPLKGAPPTGLIPAQQGRKAGRVMGMTQRSGTKQFIGNN